MAGMACRLWMDELVLMVMPLSTAGNRGIGFRNFRKSHSAKMLFTDITLHGCAIRTVSQHHAN